MAARRQLLDAFSLRLDDLAGWLGIEPLAPYCAELAADNELLADIEAAVAEVDFFRTKHWESPLHIGLYRAAQYCLVRGLKPGLAVETGVLHGITTNYTLQALRRNGAGRLISVDLPSPFGEPPANLDGIPDTLPAGLGPGWIIADKYREKWELRLGAAGVELPRVFAETGSIDFFVHDSDHTYANMMLEFDLAWPALGPGGILLADNIDLNTSFFDFARKVDRQVYVLPDDGVTNNAVRFALLRK